MSSAAGKTPAPGQAVYSASKFALNGYFHSLRSEVFLPTPTKTLQLTYFQPFPFLNELIIGKCILNLEF